MPHRKNIIDIDTLRLTTIDKILVRAVYYQNYKHSKALKHKVIGNLFFEPSTRTHCSFQSAIKRCGGSYIDLEIQNSSIKKGESFEDTIKTMEQYCDALVIRHPEKGSVKKCAAMTSIPVINAGDGSREHPTQALLDLFTIRQYHILMEPINIAFCGDLKNSRACHSLIKLLDKLYTQITFYLISDDALRLDPDVIQSLNNVCISGSDISSIITKIDVLYMTRLQKERMVNPEMVQNTIITNELLETAKQNMILMHPLPRNEELPVECDANPRSKYFEQIKNGVFVRMAILDYCFHGIKSTF